MLDSKITENKKQFIVLFIILVFTVITYSKQWGIWYWQDDYLTIQAGGAGGVIEKSIKTVNWLYDSQNRFQPARLFLATLVSDIIPEEYNFGYSLTLHLINLTLLYLLLLKFRIPIFHIYSIVILFSVYGVNRYIEGVHVASGGTVFNSFLILSTLLTLIIGIEKNNKKERWIWFFFSYFFFLCLAFSYEIAFPLFITVAYVFYLFDYLKSSKTIKTHWKDFIALTPYILALALYLVSKGLNLSSGYDGAQLNISFDIFIKFQSYLRALLLPLTTFNLHMHWETVMLALLVYYLGITFIIKKCSKIVGANWDLYKEKDKLYFLLFSLFFFLSSLVLYILNSWGTPTSVMHHHLYILTIGFSMLLVTLLFSFDIIITGDYQKVYRGAILFLIIPLFLSSFINSKVVYGKDAGKRAHIIHNIKKTVQANIPDSKETDAIIFKNFSFPHDLSNFGLSHMDGALLKWFHYERYIHSGSDIVSFKDGIITYKGPVSYYIQRHNKNVLTVENNRAEIFYFDKSAENVLTYKDFIDFENKENLHQQKQIMSNDDYFLSRRKMKLLLKNSERKGYIKVMFDKDIDLSFIKNSLILVNSNPLDHIYIHNNEVYLDINHLKQKAKYLLVDIVGGFIQYDLNKTINKVSLSDDFQGEELKVTAGNELFSILSEKNYQLGDILSFNDTLHYFTFIDWHQPEIAFRWNKGSKSKVILTIDNFPPTIQKLHLQITGMSHGKQMVWIYINNTLVGKELFSGQPEVKFFEFDANLIKQSQENIIEFQIPGAKSPNTTDPRVFGFALNKIGLLY
ncbi:MAG: hypothetical protein HQK84_05960 [Nitrospinae bacterium]|nr:hypothetical protein [Nitrospinota bacterium]